MPINLQTILKKNQAHYTLYFLYYYYHTILLLESQWDVKTEQRFHIILQFTMYSINIGNSSVTQSTVL